MAAKAFSSLLAIALLPACAHSTSSPTSGSAKHTAAMSTTPPDHTNSQLSAEEIGKRFLQLIEGLDSSEDLSLQRVKDVTRLPIHKATHGDFFGFQESLGDGWEYVLSYYQKNNSNKNYITLRFILGDERLPDLSPVCAFAFVDYHNALKDIEYVDYPKYGEIGDIIEWMYRKGDIVIAIVPEMKYSESEKRFTPTCVRSISTLN